MRRSQIACLFAGLAALNQISRVHGIPLPNPISLLPATTQERPTEKRYKVESVSYRESGCRKPNNGYERVLVRNGTCLK